jgi:Helix-hairpin-helix motif
MKNILVIILLNLFSSLLYSQIDTSDIIDEKLFQLIEDATENLEDVQFYDIIEELFQNPINLNSATRKEILRLPFLTPQDAEIIIKERNRRKGFTTLNEINSIKNIHPDLVILMKPFIKISKRDQNITHGIDKVKKFKLQFRSRIISDVQTRSGFKNGNYQGDKIKSYNRFKAGYNFIKIGILSEKDAGENLYYDHYSGFLEYKSPTMFRQMILGDYTFEFGQGLALWSPYAISKGNEAVSAPFKRERNFSPHLSSEENKFFRGISATLKFKSILINSFYSSHKIDASLSDLDEVTNLFISGYHRTDSENSKSDVLKENSYGMSVNFNLNNILDLGVLHFINKFDKPFIYENQHKLSGNNFSYSSFSYKLSLSNIYLNGELSDNTNSFASITNLYLGITKQIEVLASYRNYSPSYYNIYANGFGEYGNTQNEIGYYLGTKIKTDYGTLNFYYDIFNSPSQSYKSNFPACGREFLANISSKIFNNSILNLKFKREEKEVSVNEVFEKKIRNEIKSNYRIEIKYKLNKHLQGKTRFELVNYSLSGNNETGFLTFQELKYKIQNLISFSARIIFFETESYYSRLYEFENDIRGAMTNIPMFNEGLRWYLLINYQPIKTLNFYLKYSETYKPDLSIISSGNSEIIGNVDNRISLQLDYDF